jgi:hypothetical protein
MPERTDLNAELDRLYRGPAGSFTAERNALARALRSSGDRAAAEEVAHLARPSPVAWVVNQLHFRAPALLDALEQAGRALRASQESAAGHEDLAAKKRAHQDALRAAVSQALLFGEEGGVGGGAGLKRRVEMTLSLLSAAGDAPHARPGRMSVELEPVGFDAFTSVAAAPMRKPRPSGSPGTAAHDQKMEQLRAALDAAHKELRRLEREAEANQAAHARAVRELGDAERRVLALREARDEAQRIVEEATARVQGVRAQLDDAQRALDELSAIE